MGHGKRIVPNELSKKLKIIRESFDLGLEDMLKKIIDALEILKFNNIKIYRGHIKEFEQGLREPSLPVVLAYARLANIYVDVLIDDELELPEQLPAQRREQILDNRFHKL